MKTHETFDFLDFVKNSDIFSFENTKSSNTTKLTLSLDILSKLISFTKIRTSFLN